MTLRVTQFAAMCGFGLLVLPFAVRAQAPRYQSPLSVEAPRPQINLPAPAPITPDGKVIEDVIVRVGDQIITRSDLIKARQQLAAENQQRNLSPEEAADREKNLLRDMIDQQLLLAKGKELDINVDSEVIRQLDELRKKNNLATMEDLEAAARQQGLNFEDVKSNIRNQLITNEVVRGEVGRHLQPTQAQEQAFYDAHKNEFAQPEQVRLSEIMVPLPDDASDAAIAQAQARADEISARIKAGSSFDELAKTYSGGPTASQGGDLGYFKRGALAKVLEDQTFGLPAGQVTAPIRTRQGFVVLKVTEHQQAGPQPFSAVEPQVQEALIMEAMQPALRTYLTQLREEIYNEVQSGFVDTGASPRQTKFVFTAFQPPTARKKTKAQKQRFVRGGRFAEVRQERAAASAPAGATVASNNPQKRVKIKREKIRYGQAPRTSLPAGSQQATEGIGAGGASSTQAADAGAAVAPGEAIAPTGTMIATDEDPLAPKPANAGKTRFSSRARAIAAEKADRKAAAEKERIAATPAGPTAEEQVKRQVQSAPLGIAGKKPAKKRAPKTRLRNATPPPPPAEPAPTVNPAIGTTPAGMTPPAPTTQPAPETKP